MGNLMNSEIYGIQTDLPWGFIFAGAGEVVPNILPRFMKVWLTLQYLHCFIRFIGKRMVKLEGGIFFQYFPYNAFYRQVLYRIYQGGSG
jgi:prolipoprotein diacylglyceryltransferase